MTSEDLFVLFGVACTAVFLAVVIIAVLAGWCRSLWNWWRPEPRWAYLVNRDDVMVLDVSTFGSLDNQAEVTDAAVIDTHGNVLLTDLRARAVRALPPNHMLATPRYHDVLGPLMRVLKRASIICATTKNSIYRGLSDLWRGTVATKPLTRRSSASRKSMPATTPRMALG